MKDSQRKASHRNRSAKYIKADNERFSTRCIMHRRPFLSISRLIMKDSQLTVEDVERHAKYIKADNERFSTSHYRRGNTL